MDQLEVEINEKRKSAVPQKQVNPLFQHMAKSDDFDYHQFKFDNIRKQRLSEISEHSLAKPKRKVIKVDKVYNLDENEFIDDIIIREEENQFENCDLESSGSNNSSQGGSTQPSINI